MSQDGQQLPVVMLMGPTGAGKTDLAMDLVAQLPVDIISVDSVMVYRHMDIGSGKPDATQLARAPHRLIDVREPSQPYSAAEFCDDARREIATIHAAGRVPLLVGGTGLYFRALTRGLSELPPADPQTRQRLAEQAQNIGWAAMHRRLRAIDPTAAERIHPNDPQRIQRALEVYELTGSTLTALVGAQPLTALTFPCVSFVLSPADRSTLHDRIAVRFQGMLDAGLVTEVESLRQRAGVERDLPSMRSVGYRQVWEYLEDEVDQVGMQARAIAATRQLARRQLTWLRAERDSVWLEPGPRALAQAAMAIERLSAARLAD